MYSVDNSSILCMGKSFYLSFFIVLTTLAVFAQKASQDSLVDRKLYQKNIKIYKGILKMGPNGEISLKLAEALKQIGSYNESSEEYEKVIDKPGINPIHYKNYSTVLAKIGEKQESERWEARFKEYERRADKLSEAHVDLDTGTYFINRAPFNSTETDFGPSYYKKGLLFVSAYTQDSKNTVHEGTGESFYQFYYAARKADGNFHKPIQIFKQIDAATYEGPVALSKDFNSIFLIKNNLGQLKTKSRDKSVKLQLVSGQIVADEITNIQSFVHNDGIHSFSNPTMSADGKELYFVSNMDTISGSIDIYVSKWQNDKWSKPENLGQVVNSTEDEMYPFISRSGKLYFSSQRSDSYGGLDIYMTEKKDGKWTTPFHLPLPINGIFDDFSFITDEESNESFLASNRAGSLGRDDIFICMQLYKSKEEQEEFQYRLLSLVNKDNFITQNGNKIKGKLKPNSPDVDFKGVTVQLLDKNKKVVRSCHVAKDGYFSFSNLHPEDYMIVYEKEKVNATPEITITNKSPENIDPEDLHKYKIGYVSRDSLQNKQNRFVVGRLDDLNKNTPKDETVSLLLVDSIGKVIKRVEVGKDHYFVFRNLSSDNYYLLTEDNNPHYQCHMFYHNPDKSKAILRNDLLQYHFKHLTSDSLRENNIIIHGHIKHDQPDGSIVLLLDKDDNVIDRTVSNKEGYFVFRELDGEDMHLFVMNDHPLMSLEHGTVYQAEDSAYHVTKSMIYKKLPFEDAFLKERVLINGRVTMEGKAMSDKLVLLVDKTNKVVKHTKTNEDGFFAFHKLNPDDYYLVFGENEKGYLLEKNINLEDPALMVRKEQFDVHEKKADSFFAIQGSAFNKKDKSVVSDKLMLLMDGHGRIIRQTVVSKEGKFTFANLHPDNYLAFFRNYDPEQAAEMKVIQDATTKLVQQENGKKVTYVLPLVKEDNKTVVFFELRSDVLDKKYKEEIKKIAKSIPSSAKHIEVLGYADMSGSAEYNLTLSERRAKNCATVLRELLKREIQVIEKPIGATDQFMNTYGTYMPALNRRVEIIVTQ